MLPIAQLGDWLLAPARALRHPAPHRSAAFCSHACFSPPSCFPQQVRVAPSAPLPALGALASRFSLLASRSRRRVQSGRRRHLLPRTAVLPVRPTETSLWPTPWARGLKGWLVGSGSAQQTHFFLASMDWSAAAGARSKSKDAERNATRKGTHGTSSAKIAQHHGFFPLSKIM
jgi:hypothetical protein